MQTLMKSFRRDNSPAGKLQRAMNSLLLTNPFFGILANKLCLVPSQEIETAATDGTEIRFNPTFIKELPFPECKSILAEAVMHCALLHPWRCGTREIGLWNQAADHAVMSILHSNKFELTEVQRQRHSIAYNGMSAERIYALLEKQPKSEQPQASPQIGADDGDGQEGDQSQQQNQDASDGDGQIDQNQPQNSDDSQDGNQGSEQGDEQSSGGCDFQKPAPEQMSKSDQRKIEKDWMFARHTAMQAGKMQGMSPGDAESAINAVPDPTLVEYVRDFACEIAEDDFNFMIRNRYYSQTQFIIPAEHSENLGDIVFVFDTSGSMTIEELNDGIGKMYGIFEEFGEFDAWLIQCDSKVQEAGEITQADFPIEKILGRGGTKFAPAFEWLEENDIHPKALIYVSDMFCEDYPPAPDFPVLWVTKTPSGQGFDEFLDPPFGQLIQVDEF